MTTFHLLDTQPLHAPSSIMSQYLKGLNEDQLKLIDTDGDLHLGDQRASGRTTTMLVLALYELLFKPASFTIYMVDSAKSLDHARYQFETLLKQQPEVIKSLTVYNARELATAYDSRLQFKSWSHYALTGIRATTLMLDNISQFKDQHELLHNISIAKSLGARIIVAS